MQRIFVEERKQCVESMKLWSDAKGQKCLTDGHDDDDYEDDDPASAFEPTTFLSAPILPK